MSQQVTPIIEHGRTPIAAAVAGLLFSAILIVALVLLHLTIGEAGAGAEWADQPSRRGLVTVATSLIPFAGISFLWFVGVIRTRLGVHEDRLFATVFLGSGLLFVAMLFAAAAVLATLLSMLGSGVESSADLVLALQELTRQLAGTFGARMAAVFIISATSAGMRGHILPRWLVVVGYLAGVALLLTPPVPRWGQLVFPVWVMLVSLTLLAHARAERVPVPS